MLLKWSQCQTQAKQIESLSELQQKNAQVFSVLVYLALLCTSSWIQKSRIFIAVVHLTLSFTFRIGAKDQFGRHSCTQSKREEFLNAALV